MKMQNSAEPQQTARLILQAAEQGNLQAQALLGQLLLEGRGIQQDAELAVQWFEIAAKQGHQMARNMLGRCLEHGWGCPQNLSAAATEYAQAAAAGLDWAIYNLANLLATGRGVPTDEARALALYQQAAVLGHSKAMNLLGRFYEEGRILARNPQKARRWYRRSARAGDCRGQFSYAGLLLENDDLETALFWLEKARQSGTLNFLRFARQELQSCGLEALQAMTLAYYRRAAELGEPADLKQLQEALQLGYSLKAVTKSEEDEPETFHWVMREFTYSFGKTATSLPSAELQQIGI